ncbi:methylenetetrahydrofolate reductase [Fulvivirgaceae bacterium PWU4]|uniref:Methylenetetrahydrofolate reductase n=1 Tax=Chryseosolibacter histidini TaxID=2782349 RepID=A0AAP2DS05_9BACT|nr:methylenetetrahydrofolate reductase [Chryseosolibacter histidini]MBT1700429.1 methylenetetrahydrofolate reductase [Chryseosolibacter histidini]
MFLTKIRRKESGILLYGITPPKVQTAPEKITEIAERTFNILHPLDIDALVVYDVQDESARTTEERPFPFASALDPFEYTSQHLQRLTIPKIIYRPAGKFTREELTQWLNGLKTHGFYPVFVGLPSPDYVVKTSLGEAYQLWREQHAHHSVIGAVTIPERHAVLKDEDVRILDKVSSGVSYFISQCVFNVDYARQMLEALVTTCANKNQELPTVIFTLTICGSVKTLHFMEWLGIHIPEAMKEELKVCSSPVARSVEIATSIAQDLIRYCQEKAIPFGFNIESVATRKEEIDASLELLNTVRELLKVNGLRSEVKAHQFVNVNR